MQKQMSFAQNEYERKKKQTRRERFLAEMEQVVPWAKRKRQRGCLYAEGA
jgi:transposase, IS5 family